MLASAGAPALAQDTRAPYVRVAEIEIDPAQLDAYKAAVEEQIETAIRLEAGVLAQYCVSDRENPSHITVFEIYADAEAYKAHLDTAHFQRYKINTQAMVRSLKLRDVVPVLLGAKPR
ncbi:MAG TPA: putative quinol monooxygenase [Bradyrhizobium sp.]|nr:putative quinol monooxygenase [Bradyrhizobium sp.]